MRVSSSPWPLRTRVELLAQALGLAGERVGAPRVRGGRGLERLQALLGLARLGAQLADLLLVAGAQPAQLRAGAGQVALELLAVSPAARSTGSSRGLGRSDDLRLRLPGLRLAELGLRAGDGGREPPLGLVALAGALPAGRRQVDGERADLELGLADVVVRALPREGGEPRSPSSAVHGLCSSSASSRRRRPATCTVSTGRTKRRPRTPNQRPSTSRRSSPAHWKRSSSKPVCSGATVRHQRVLSSIRPLTSSTASCTWPCTSRLSCTPCWTVPCAAW